MQCLRELHLASLKQPTECGPAALTVAVFIASKVSSQARTPPSDLIWKGQLVLPGNFLFQCLARLHVFSHIRQHDNLLAALTEALLSLPLRRVNYLD